MLIQSPRLKTQYWNNIQNVQTIILYVKQEKSLTHTVNSWWNQIKN